MACASGETTSISGSTTTAAATIFAVHPDIIQTHILKRLDGPALASAATTFSQFYALSTQEYLWANICHSTWPSTNSPRIRYVISSFPGASRAFFSDAFTTLQPSTVSNSQLNPDRTPELISAIDLYYRDRLVFSKVVETETVSGWFRCSPFRVDLLDPKDVILTSIQFPKGDNACGELKEDLRLSWIVIDPAGRRAINVSSQKPASVKRHWLRGEVQVRFATVLVGDRGSASESALCGLLVVCGEAGEGEMQVREASMQMEDMDGMHLNGRDSLGILQRALEGKRGRKIVGLEEEARKGYQEFEKRKEERKEMKLRAEGRLDMLCVGLAALSFASLFSMFVSWK